MSPKTRYPSDLTDDQWAAVEALLPYAKQRGRPAGHQQRDIVDAILYVVRSGCAWRQMPNDFPPWETAYWWFARWRDDGSLDTLHDQLRIELRRLAGRD